MPQQLHNRHIEYRQLLNFETEPGITEVTKRYSCDEPVNLYLNVDDVVVYELLSGHGESYLVRCVPVRPFMWNHLDMAKFGGENLLHILYNGWVQLNILFIQN